MPTRVRTSRDLRTRPTTSADAASRRVPMKTARNIRRGHLIKGIREINRIDWDPLEKLVADGQRVAEFQRFNRENQFFDYLSRVEGLLREVRVREQEMQRTNEELLAINEELQSTTAELKTTTEELEQSNAYRKRLTDLLPDLLVTVDVGGRITETNKAAERISGYSIAELMSRRLQDLFAESERAALFIQQAASGTDVASYELEFVTKAGKRIPVSFTAVSLVEPEGGIRGVLGIIRDITDQRLAQETLRYSEARLRAAMDNMADGVIIIDSSGIMNSFNLAAEEIFGYEAAEVVGQNLKMLMPEPYHSNYDAYIANYLKTGERKMIGIGREVIGRRKNGSTFPLELAVGEIYVGNEHMFIGVVRDITERRKEQEELARQAEALRRSNEQLEQFAYVASHDLQEPLRIVTVYTKLLAERYKGRLDSDADEFIQFAVGGVDHMRNLINDLLLYSRVISQDRSLKATPCQTAVEQAMANLQMAIEESAAQITFDPLPVINGNPTQLVQLFQNLFSNAIKFRGQEKPRIHISVRKSLNEWTSIVKDNGIGIAPEYHNRIFQIFQRLHGKTEYPGMGIGLAICKQIVERMGGRIWLESEMGKGAAFMFTVPVDEQLQMKGRVPRPLSKG
ncbi:MAG: PAS domain S-box protein [SAR202 cluster bacterium]|nr:PAS domain S-box protein [SAR202 cluster bacterium]